MINQDGFSFEEIRTLFLNKNGNALSADNMLSFDEVNAKIWDLEAEVFIPCAASRLITKDQIDRMISTGIEVVAAGANVPFADPEIFFGPIADYSDEKISIIPDFISNCGMARVFAYLMGNDLAKIEDEDIFGDTSRIIKKALENSYAVNNSKTRISKTSFEIALKQLI